MNEYLVAVIHADAWKRQCAKMTPEERSRFAPDGTLGEVGMFEGARIIVQDSLPSEWRQWGYLNRDLPAVFL